MKVIDRFHVQTGYRSSSGTQNKAYRWEAIDKENEILKQAKDEKTKPEILIFENGDTENKSWQEAVIYSTKAEINGQKANAKELKFCLMNILI